MSSPSHASGAGVSPRSRRWSAAAPGRTLPVQHQHFAVGNPVSQMRHDHQQLEAGWASLGAGRAADGVRSYGPSARTYPGGRDGTSALSGRGETAEWFRCSSDRRTCPGPCTDPFLDQSELERASTVLSVGSSTVSSCSTGARYV